LEVAFLKRGINSYVVLDHSYISHSRDNLFNFLEKDVEIALGVKEGEICKMDQNKKRN